MTTLTKYERGNTIKSDVDFKMNSVLTDPSGSVAKVHVIKADGTYLVSGASASRDSTGEYHYYFRTEDNDPLGIYIIEWYGYHYLGASYGVKKLRQRSQIEIVDTTG